jgi:AcrR family transcriptional regulator
MPRVVARETRAEILETALELFATKGYGGASLREIAERLGITKAALYYHFPAKEDLLLALVEPVVEQVEHLVAHPGGDAVQFLASYIELVLEHGETLGFLLREPTALNHPELGRRQWEVVQKVRARLAGPRADETARLRAAMALGALHGGLLGVPPERLRQRRAVLLAAAMAALGSPAAGAAQDRAKS